MSSRARHHVTVVVPVYGDWSSLADCIASLKRHVDTTAHKVMLVNDCGPEVEVMEKNIQAAIQDAENFHYYRNDKNLGFVGTCNRAVMELDKTTNDILLLNSDTIVTEGFLDEMREALYNNRHVGAVSPRTNNATIATIPLSAAPQKGIGPEASYKLYKKMKPKLPRFTTVPVAHGFCMLIRRTLIKKYGLFDTAFGKGYGEEVDFCMRIAKHGHTCMLSNWAYVYHMEARSFSHETKAKLLEEHNQIIWSRWPHYRQSVRNYMKQALVEEGSFEQAAGYKEHLPADTKAKLTQLIKRNRRIYKLAQSINGKLKK